MPRNLALPEMTSDELASVQNVTDRKQFLLLHRIPLEHVGRAFSVVRDNHIDLLTIRVRPRYRQHTTRPRPDSRHRARLAPTRPVNEYWSIGDTCRCPSSLGKHVTARALSDLNAEHKATAAPATTNAAIQGVRLTCVPCHASALHVEPSIPTSRPAYGLLAPP